MFKKIISNPLWLLAFNVVSLMIPVIILTITEHNPLLVALTAILLPLGFYLLFSAASTRSGRMVWWGFPFIFLSAFQIVLSYLFGNSVIATDMFLNLTTTNPGEAGELLGNIYPSVIAVCVIYLPLLWFATEHLRRQITIPTPLRQLFAKAGCASLVAGILTFLFIPTDEKLHTLRDETFPVNACYNMGLAISESYKINHYEQSSAGFTFDARRSAVVPEREIYVLVIGEASRASNWQLYGYDRPTNPHLSTRNDLVLFRGVTTQSNTTHKSVPLMLSSVHTSEHDELFRRTGLPALFNEAGFTTYFISNQAPQGAMIDFLADDADRLIYLDAPNYDGQLVDVMLKALDNDSSDKLLFILHTYGSHFSYHQRYPREEATFLPDDDVAISLRNAEFIRNAYDNSILYTDQVLNDLIALLEREDACSAMFYCADHGEDLFDTAEGRFLHSSPTTTYHQLHVASLAWFSPKYKSMFSPKAEAAASNAAAPATTYSVFHTMADIASICSPYFNTKASLVSPEFDYSAPRLYLDDHNRAVPLDREIGIDDEQRAFFHRAGINP
ncbi:MAG: lipid A phosphoethanolamine transferase [Rikenellaceae bacterium]|nr:lipid A phosphoethanolamine transferase [Rikenellaceae bacterium]